MKFKEVNIEKIKNDWSNQYKIEFIYDESELEFPVLKSLIEASQNCRLDFSKNVGRFSVESWVGKEEKDVPKKFKSILDSSTFAMIYINDDNRLVRFLANFRVKNNELFQRFK